MLEQSLARPARPGPRQDMKDPDRGPTMQFMMMSAGPLSVNRAEQHQQGSSAAVPKLGSPLGMRDGAVAARSRDFAGCHGNRLCLVPCVTRADDGLHGG